MALPIIPNIALERLGAYCQLAHDQPTGFTTAVLKWVLLLNTGLEADTVLRDYANLDLLLKRGGGSQVAEATFTGYSRTPANGAIATTDISVTTDNTNDKVLLDITKDPSWNPTSAQDIGAIVLAYWPASAGADSTAIPIFIDACVQTTGTGGAATPLTYVVATGGFNSGIQA